MVEIKSHANWEVRPDASAYITINDLLNSQEGHVSVSELPFIILWIPFISI